MKEKWRSLGHIGFRKYKISSFGRIKNEKDIMSPSFDKDGYLVISLWDRNTKKYKQFFVHRLVAMTFINNPDNFSQVNHIDGNKHNNVVWNLEWCTCKQNILHKYSILGCINKCATPIKVKCIETGITYRSMKDAARDIGVSESVLHRAVKKETRGAKGLHFIKISRKETNYVTN